MAGVLEAIWGSGEAEYFFERDWTGQITLKSLPKIGRARTPTVLPSRRKARAETLRQAGRELES